MGLWSPHLNQFPERSPAIPVPLAIVRPSTHDHPNDNPAISGFLFGSQAREVHKSSGVVSSASCKGEGCLVINVR